VTGVRGGVVDSENDLSALCFKRGPISIADGPPVARYRTMASPLVGGRDELGPPLVPYTAQIIIIIMYKGPHTLLRYDNDTVNHILFVR